MTTLEIILRKDLDDARLDEVRTFLRTHNHAVNPVYMQEAATTPPLPLAVVGLTSDGQVAGGLIGETRGRWLRVTIMAVREDRRRRGRGRRS